jgi:hypothetical protein
METALALLILASAVAMPLVLVVTQNKLKSKIMKRLSQSHSRLQSGITTEYTVSETRKSSFSVFDETSQFLHLLEKSEDSRALWIKMRRHSWVGLLFFLILLVAIGTLVVAIRGECSSFIVISLMGFCFLYCYFGYALLTLLYAKLVPSGRNLVLLILRVFNNNCSHSLFSGYLRQWKLIGSRVFIVDNSYLEAIGKESLTFKRVFNAIDPLSGQLTDKTVLFQSGLLPSVITVLWIAIVVILDVLLLSNPENGVVNQSILLGILWILGPTIVVVRNRILERSLIKAYTCNAESIRSVASNKNRFGASLFGVYNDMSFYCNDGVWREVFVQLLESPDAILMDLRGFQEKNIGCMYEIGGIMKSPKRSRVLYIINDDTDLLLLRNIFGSVTQNVDRDNRPINVYRVSSSESPGDVENVLQMLCLMALGHSAVPESS